MSEVFGLFLLYVIPGTIAALFWVWPIRRLINLWTGRDVMLGFIPKAWDVHHSERLLGTRTRPKPKESTFLALLSEYGKRGRNH